VTEDRFEVKGAGINDPYRRKLGGLILVDKKTRVQYLYVNEAYNGSGITVIVDENGKPLLDKEE